MKKDISQIVLEAQATISQIKTIIAAPINEKQIKELVVQTGLLKLSVNQLDKWVKDEQIITKNS